MSGVFRVFRVQGLGFRVSVFGSRFRVLIKGFSGLWV